MLVIAGLQTIRTNTKRRRSLLSLVCFNFGRGTPTKAKTLIYFLFNYIRLHCGDFLKTIAFGALIATPHHFKKYVFRK
jgi:hypothetical protein